MAPGIGAEHLRTAVGDVHADVAAAAGNLLAPVPADVYGGPGVPSPGNVNDDADVPKPPPYPGSDGSSSPYGGPITPADGQKPPPLIGPGGNGAPGLNPPPPIAPGGHAGPVGRPAPPQGSGGLSDGADAAGSDYDASAGSTQALDDKLTREINDAVAQNQCARDKITAIVKDIQAHQARTASASADPLTLSEYQKYLDQKLGAVQQVLDDAQVNAQSKKQILDDIATEYKASGPATPPGRTAENRPAAAEGSNADGAASADGPADAGTAASDGGAAVEGQSAGAGNLIDPFAGMSGMGMNPMMGGGMGDALGALGGLGGLGSSLAGLGSAPLGALGSLGSLGQLGGLGSGGFHDQPAATAKDAAAFKDDKPADPAAATNDATDKTANKAGEPLAAEKPSTVDAGFKEGTGADGKGQPAAAEQTGTDIATGNDQGKPGAAAPAAAAPASAPGAPIDPARAVTMPDGTPVTAPNEKAATAARSVLTGQSVTDAYKAQGIDIPPPGTPVTTPVDPAHLEAGDIARFGSRPPVMAMGNGKVWMDGQLQPLSAMGSSGDFLGWSKPTAQTVMAHASAPLPPVPAVPAVTPPAAIPPGTGKPS